jgi:hypothetical protein
MVPQLSRCLVQFLAARRDLIQVRRRSNTRKIEKIGKKEKPAARVFEFLGNSPGLQKVASTSEVEESQKQKMTTGKLTGSGFDQKNYVIQWSKRSAFDVQ